MPLPVYRLRRILGATAILLTLAVAAMYFYARSKAINVLKTIPGKIGYDVKQTAKGFQFSKSDGGRTLFTVEASDIKQFRLNDRAELHKVNIVLYGRDSSRYDQIYGDNFSYNQKTGDVTAQGEVQIDLVANPAGATSPDQATPKELKNPIHLKTRDLVFNKDSGNAFTNARVEFETPQASGWAVGVQYSGKNNRLILSSQIHIVMSGSYAAVLEAEHGIITNDPRQIVLDHPHLKRRDATLAADQATFYLASDNHVERVLATGDVKSDVRTVKSSPERMSEQPEIHGRADQAEFLLSANEDLLHTATFSGNVHFDRIGSQPMQGEAGRLVMDFADQNVLQKVHASDGVSLTQAGSGLQSSKNRDAQEFRLTAPMIDFTVKEGHALEHAVTSGASKITITQVPNSKTGSERFAPQRTVVTAGKFYADFAASDGRSYLAQVQGEPDARVVSTVPSQPERVSTSDMVNAVFLPQGAVESITQTGNFAYRDSEAPDKQMRAWAHSARYTPNDQMLVLTGDPRVTSAGMQTTSDIVTINRSTGDAVAEGDVKSTYNELKEQPNGALLASSSPIHVTAHRMTIRNNPGEALYYGKVRLWQDANVIDAPSIQFDRDQRYVTAQGTSTQPVQTILVQAERSSEHVHKPGKKPTTRNVSSPIVLTGLNLTYADSDRRVHYEGGVVAKGADFTASAKELDAYLLPRSQTATSVSLPTTGQLDRMVAKSGVLIQQPNRRAEGQKLVYTTADDKFVLTGGPPSIFDAEQGKITGVSLTFFRHDDRVLVEGEASAPVVTTTRVAH